MAWSLFRRSPATLQDLEPAGAADDALTDEAAPSPPRRPGRRRQILALVLSLIAVGWFAIRWLGTADSPPSPPRPPLIAQPGPLAPAPPAPPAQAPAPAAGEAGQAARPAEPAQPAGHERPDFFRPIESAPAAGAADGAWSELARAQHEFALEEQRMRLAEARLKRVRAEAEAREIERNPSRLFKRDEPEAPRLFSQLPRGPVPQPQAAAPPVPAQPQPGARELAQAAPPRPEAPPLRVLMVSGDEEPEALVQSLDGSSGGGLFTVRRGDSFPEFTVVSVDGRGVTVSAQGRGYFYPLGGVAIGARLPAQPAQARPQAAPQAAAPPQAGAGAAGASPAAPPARR
jgi:hypothetical protein